MQVRKKTITRHRHLNQKIKKIKRIAKIQNNRRANNSNNNNSSDKKDDKTPSTTTSGTFKTSEEAKKYAEAEIARLIKENKKGYSYTLGRNSKGEITVNITETK